MAIIDWPTTRPFQGARLELDLAVSRAGFAGYYTGNRQTVSHLADRRTATLTLPPCKGADGPARQAFLHGLMSRGDWLRMGVPHQPFPRGTLRGGPTVSASVAAGARSVALVGGLSGVNLLNCGGLDGDSNGDGLADGVGALTSGAASGVVYSMTAENARGQAQKIVATLPNSGATAGLSFPALSAVGLASVSASAYVRGVAPGSNAVLLIDQPSGAFSKSQMPVSNDWARISVAHVLAPATGLFYVYLWVEGSASGGAVQVFFDSVQVEPGAAVSEFAGNPSLAPGDWLSIGGNLVQVDYPGATLSDAGAGTVPLVAPLQRPITAGAAVTWANPTGLWELDADSLPLNFNPGSVADGVALPLREVFA